jgi:hypothetical protein
MLVLHSACMQSEQVSQLSAASDRILACNMRLVWLHIGWGCMQWCPTNTTNLVQLQVVCASCIHIQWQGAQSCIHIQWQGAQCQHSKALAARLHDATDTTRLWLGPDTAPIILAYSTMHQVCVLTSLQRCLEVDQFKRNSAARWT